MIPEDSEIQDPLPASDRAFLGHPKGLGFLAFTEAWERFSYYGMQTLLVLYMTQQLLLPGHVERIAGFDWFRGLMENMYGAHTTVALASAIFGTYTSLVYLSPLLGGLIADRILGKTRTIVLGGTSMAIGHFLMAFDVSFLAALACLVFGAGCFKGNIASQVGGLYRPGDNRPADAFQIFYLAINAGVIAAPLVAGTLGQKVGWHYGFGVAGVGMVVGLMIYLSGRKYLPPDAGAGSAAGEKPRWRRGDGAVLLVLLALLPVLAVAVVGNQQIFNAYLLWANDNANFNFMGWDIPSTWLVTIDTIASVSCLAGAVVFWRVWAKFAKEPTEMVKIGIGSLIAVTGLVCLAAAAWTQAQTGQKINLGWLIAFHILNSIGFANVFPVALAFYSRTAPPALGATMIGIFYLHLFAANQFVGWLGGLLEKMPATSFWLMHAAMAGAAGVAFLLLKPLVAPILYPKPAEN
jgi:POT family proton-dependent oligopeptide transporter